MNTISLVNVICVEAGPNQQSIVVRQHHVGRFYAHTEAEKQVTIGASNGHLDTHTEAENQAITSVKGYFHKGVRYNYCVIKEITLDLYPRVVREDWFKWIDGRYSHLPKPPVQEIISSYSSCIGKRVNGSNIE